MEMIVLRYNGGRSMMKAVYNRKRYIFNKANDFIAEVPAELAKELLVTGQYLPAAKSTPKENTSIEFNGVGDVVDLNNDFTCGICGFKAKSEQGSLVHKAKHTREGKK